MTDETAGSEAAPSEAAQGQHRPRSIAGDIALVLLGALAAALGAAVYSGIHTRAAALASLERATEEAAIPFVSFTHPKVGAPTEEIVLPGSTQAFTDTPIYARTSGYLRRWYCDIGAYVKQGQLLAEIETPEIDQQLQQARADLQTARLSLQAELALDDFELRSADAQKQLLDDTVKAYTAALELTRNRFEGGAAPKSEVAQAQTQLDTARVQDTDIGAERAQYEHAIAVLIGKPPAAFRLPASPLNLQPPDIPVGVPSQLLERRPDVASAERRVAEANEQIGIARAAYYPTVTLTGSAGFEGTSILNWLEWPSRFWAVGPSLLETLFDAGRRRATSEAALANYDASIDSYRKSVLDAFQQVEDNLAALRVLQQETQQQQDALAAARESLELSTNRYKGGVDNYLQVLTAQTIALANDRNDVDILRRRMDAAVLLVKALRGGWNVSSLPQLTALH